ncbi:Na+/H+ antiporter subunit A [soil metagenome]
MILVLAVHVVVAAAAVVLGTRLGRRVMLVGALAPAASLVWVATVLSATTAGGAVTEHVAWVPVLGLDIDFRLDAFAALMVGLIGGIGVLVFVYAWRYFGDKEGLGRFASYLVVFAGSMFGLVTADNLLLLFIFWELTSITSYLLIGFEDRSAIARASALQALLVTGAGGLAMLGGLVLVAQAAGTYSLSSILAEPPGTTAAGVGLALVLVGTFTKSAQFPFHFWLPGAMTAPTPVSAYLHSATMVKAGIYLVARLAPAFVGIFGWWRPVVVAVGLTTMLVGGWRALAQNDLKLVLAQGTVSQLGFIMVLVGIGLPELTFAGMAMILAHAIFKASLFMVAGIIDHQVHTRDLRRLTGLRTRMPTMAAVSVVALASMAGVPPLLGFVSKEAALEGLVHDAAWWVTAVIVVGSALTMAYGLRFLWGAFATKPPDTIQDAVGPEADVPSFSFLLPPTVLATASVVAGVSPRLVDGVVVQAATALDPLAGDYHLALWHGIGLAPALSFAALFTGWLLWRRPPHRLRIATARLPDANRLYSRGLSGLNRMADRVTSVVQSGSLPIYLGIILTTAVVAPGILLVRHWIPLENLVVAESPVQGATALLVVAAAMGTVFSQRRLGAVLYLGAVGYGVAVLFVIQGAPDLALTQLLVETLALALFILVLRRLPQQFERVEWHLGRITRMVIAVSVGLTAGAFSLWAAAGREAEPLVNEFLTRAEPEGGGQNVVNVILTDFRALDTLGEITVLTVAALGVMALVRAGTTREDLDPQGADTGEGR